MVAETDFYCKAIWSGSIKKCFGIVKMNSWLQGYQQPTRNGDMKQLLNKPKSLLGLERKGFGQTFWKLRTLYT